MRRFFGTSAFAALVLSLSINLVARAQLNPDYGHYSQLNGATQPLGGDDYASATLGNDANGNPLAPVACAPTATMNSFQMLENKYGVTGLVGGNAYTSIENLAADMGTQGDSYYNPASPNYHTTHTGGTSAAGLVNGKIDYIAGNQTGGPEIKVEVQSDFGHIDPDTGHFVSGGGTTPDADFLREQLDLGQDIEVWEAWLDADGNYDGAHIITITNLLFDDGTQTGTVDFVDPWGEDGTADDITGTVTIHNGHLSITYPAPDVNVEGGDDADNPDNAPNQAAAASQADIRMVVAESPVPEPTTGAMVLCASITVFAMRRQRRAA